MLYAETAPVKGEDAYRAASARGGTLPPEPLWTPDDVSTYLAVSVRTLRRIRAEDPTFPPPARVGGQLRWWPDEVEAWVRTRQARRKVRPRRPGRPPSARVGR